jgi:hypothetical protein
MELVSLLPTALPQAAVAARSEKFFCLTEFHGQCFFKGKKPNRGDLMRIAPR